MTNPTPTLGVLDWGVGGLGVVQALHSQGFDEPVVYLSDTGATAYGRLQRDDLTRRVELAITRLVALRATRILIACNAASTVIGQLRSPVPVHGVIEPTLTAMRRDPALRVGVIGGVRTIRSGVYRQGLALPGRHVIQRIAQPLSAHIETGTIRTPTGQRDLYRIVAPLRGVDALVLACTHYPAIASQIQALLPRVRLVDPAHAVTQRLVHLPRQDTATSIELRVLTTGDPRGMQRAAIAAWHMDPGTCTHVAL